MLQPIIIGLSRHFRLFYTASVGLKTPFPLLKGVDRF
jgi:hypothetical protein